MDAKNYWGKIEFAESQMISPRICIKYKEKIATLQ